MAALPDLRPVEGKYEILRKLGEGGMGIVYLVRHRLLHELRVVKVLRGQLRGQDELRERFLREARTAIHLRHPNVAQLYEFELDDDGTAYMVLEFIDGRTVDYAACTEQAQCPGQHCHRQRVGGADIGDPEKQEQYEAGNIQPFPVLQ